MRKIHLIRTALLPCLLLFSASLCAAEDIKKIHPAGFVSDLAGAIAPEARTRLETLFSELERKSGALYPIVTVESLLRGSVADYPGALLKPLRVAGKRHKLCLL